VHFPPLLERTLALSTLLRLIATAAIYRQVPTGLRGRSAGSSSATGLSSTSMSPWYRTRRVSRRGLLLLATIPLRRGRRYGDPASDVEQSRVSDMAITTLDDDDRAWLEARLVEYQQLLAYLRDH
jgi:hypothetical protein